VLTLPVNDNPEELFDSVLHTLHSNPGNCDVALEAIIDGNKIVRVKTNSALKVDRNPTLELELQRAGCTIRIEKFQTNGSDNGQEVKRATAG